MHGALMIGLGFQIAPARFTIGSVNLAQRRKEAERRAKAEAKRERREARRREKAGVPSAGPVK